MKVSFNGLYKIAGKTNPQEKYRTLNDMSKITNFKLDNFIRDTKLYRDSCGYSYYNNKTGDYYFTVKDEFESEFEDEVNKQLIDCVKVGSMLVENNCEPSEEIDALATKRTENYKRKINNMCNKEK